MRSRRRARLAVVVVVAAAVAVACDRTPERDAPAADRPAPPQVVLLGLDGATWDLLDPLIAAGRLPNLARLERRGARGDLGTMLPSLSPALWTTIATGKTPDRHGITDFFRTDESGRRIPIDSTMREARTFWEILGDFGLSSCVVYWWNTWPAEPMTGALVSDYLFYSRNAIQNARPVERDKLLERAAWPPELAPFLVNRLEAAASLSPDLVRTVVDFDDTQMTSFLEQVDARLGEARTTNALSVLKNKLIESEFHRTVGLELVSRTHFDFHVYYSKGIDATGHVFWRFFEPDAPVYANQRPSPAEIALYRDVIPDFYAYEDRNVGRVLERAGKDTHVIVVSDHGHHAGGHEDGPDGVFLLAGPGVREGVRIEGATIRDIAPLILYLLDVPVGEDMDGDVPTTAFTEEHLAAHPPRTVPTHERARDVRPARPDEAVTSALLEELRALGYVR